MIIVTAKNWSENVKTDWHPPKGFFTKSAQAIANGLKDASDDLQQAMSRLNFYINRAGANLPDADTLRLNRAKDILHNLYAEDAK